MDPGLSSLLQDIGQAFRVIHHRSGIGHADHGRKTACRRCRRSGLDIFFIGKTRIAEMHMHIHQARRNRHACRFYDIFAAVQVQLLSYSFDCPIFQNQISDKIFAAYRIDDSASANSCHVNLPLSLSAFWSHTH